MQSHNHFIHKSLTTQIVWKLENIDIVMMYLAMAFLILQSFNSPHWIKSSEIFDVFDKIYQVKI